MSDFPSPPNHQQDHQAPTHQLIQTHNLKYQNKDNLTNLTPEVCDEKLKTEEGQYCFILESDEQDEDVDDEYAQNSDSGSGDDSSSNQGQNEKQNKDWKEKDQSKQNMLESVKKINKKRVGDYFTISKQSKNNNHQMDDNADTNQSEEDEDENLNDSDEDSDQDIEYFVDQDTRVNLGDDTVMDDDEDDGEDDGEDDEFFYELNETVNSNPFALKNSNVPKRGIDANDVLFKGMHSHLLRQKLPEPNIYCARQSQKVAYFKKVNEDYEKSMIQIDQLEDDLSKRRKIKFSDKILVKNFKTEQLVTVMGQTVEANQDLNHQQKKGTLRPNKKLNLLKSQEDKSSFIGSFIKELQQIAVQNEKIAIENEKIINENNKIISDNLNELKNIQSKFNQIPIKNSCQGIRQTLNQLKQILQFKKLAQENSVKLQNNDQKQQEAKAEAKQAETTLIFEEKDKIIQNQSQNNNISTSEEANLKDIQNAASSIDDHLQQHL